MTELERRRQRKEELLYFTCKRVEIAKLMILHCQKFIDAEEKLMTETDKEERKKLYGLKRSAKYSIMMRYKQFIEPFKREE